MEQRRTLYRSRTDSVVSGVSGGLGKYFDTDPVIFRILFVVLTFLAAGGLIAYIILWIVMPEEPFDYYNRNTHFKETETMENENSDYRNKPYYNKPRNDGGLVVGVILIALGGLFLLDRLLPRIDFGDLWPVMLIVVGILIIASQVRKKSRN
jgi:phage shock protein PspC (stress-responsive transcriptional regulator)